MFVTTEQAVRGAEVARGLVMIAAQEHNGRLTGRTLGLCQEAGIEILREVTDYFSPSKQVRESVQSVPSPTAS